MQRRKSFFNNEMEQRFSLRKYTIGLCSVCLGFVTIGMGNQSVKADTVNNVEKSSVVQENKTQDADSATAKPNTTPTETKKNEVGSVATTAPKTNTTPNGVKANTADSAISTETKPTKANSTLANSNIVSAQAKSAKAELEVQPKVGATSTKIKLQETKLAKSADANNAVVVNASDQSKSEDSSAVAPTSEKNQLQTSQDSSIKVTENNLNNDKRDTKKLVAKPTNLHDESDSPTVSISYVDDDENGRLIWKHDTLTTKNSLVVTYIQYNLKKLENYILVPNQNLPDTIDVGNKAIAPIVVHLKHKTKQENVTKRFGQFAGFTLSGSYGATLSDPTSAYEEATGQALFIKGTQKYDLVTQSYIGEATWDYNHIYQGNGNDDDATEVKDLSAINSLGDLNKTYIQTGGVYSAELQDKDLQDKDDLQKQDEDLQKLVVHAYGTGDTISTQTWLKDGLHADGYYLSEKTSLIFDGKNWLNLKEYQQKVDPNFTWTTTNDSVVMLGDHAVDHINPEKITSELLPKLDTDLTNMDGGRVIYLNYVPYTYKHHSAQRTINIHLPNGEVKTVSQKADAKQPVFTVNTWPDSFYNGKSASQETGNWTGGEWAEYDAPVVAGYTASQPTVSAKAVTGDTQNETIDITYVASEHTSHVKLVDNDNKTIQDTPVMGKTGETANVSVTVPKGWQLVSGQELPTQISFNAEGHPDVVVQIEHKTIKVTPDNPKENGTVLPDNPSLHFNGVSHDDLNKTVTREVTITDPTGKKSTTTQTVTFTRGATVDEVTNKVTYDDWSENGKHTFDKVDVPTVPGYTVSGEVPEVVVTPETQSSKVDITYTANAQTATITYIDDTEKKSLGSDKQNGKFNQVITFEHDPAEVIKGLEEKGYKLVSNDFNSNKYQADNSNNVFYVHLKHGTSESSRKDDVNMTVHYVMDDGSKAPSDSKQTVSFTESGIKDNVTGNITWAPAVSQTLKDVDSPVLTGYTADNKTANGKVVNFGDPDINVTVHYSANAQTATITYIDDTEKKSLGSDKQNGKFNQVITFEHDPAEVIKGLEEKGYKLVSNDFNSNKYQADNSNNVFYVHLKHGTSESSRKDDVNMTVHYVMDDGSKAPSDNTQTVSFTESGIKDNVTGNITWAPAVSQTLKDVDSPVLTGYTADIKTVNGKVVNFGDPDINVTVHYSANAQTATITYIDDTEKKTLGSDK